MGGYCFGDSASGLDGYGWYKGNSDEKQHPGGQKNSNGWGLYDMHGNVYELCADWYDPDYYKVSPGNDPTGPPSGSERVARGGSVKDPAQSCRCTSRGGIEPKGNPGYPGFRVCLVLPDTAAERAKMSRAADAAQPSGSSAAPKAESEISNLKSQI
jgi:formylglycine-generating enzyme required for sulfatase activity